VTDIPTIEPGTLTAGDRWRWKRQLSDYPAGTWTLKYALRNAGSRIDLTATADGTDHLIDVSAATTATYDPGDYDWIAYVSDGTSRYTVARGRLTVKPDLAAADLYDSRSHARKVLEAVEAVLEKRATKDQASYSINGRSLARTPIADLLVLRDRYRAEVRREEAAERIAKGLSSGTKVLVRF